MGCRVNYSNSWKTIKSLLAAGAFSNQEHVDIKRTQRDGLKNSKEKAGKCRNTISNELRYKNSQLYRPIKQLHGQSLPPPKPFAESCFYNAIFLCYDSK